MSDESDGCSDADYFDDPNYEQVASQAPVLSNDKKESVWKQLLQEKSDSFDAMKIADSLSNAISNGDLTTVRTLLDSGVSCDQALNPSFSTLGQRPIFVACAEGQHEILALLLSRNCKLDPGEDNFTPLMAICSSESTKEQDLAKCAHELIINAGVDPNAFQIQRITALMLASKNGHEEVVVQLLKAPGLDVNARDSQQWTALMYAIDARNGHIARRLLEAGADPHLGGSDGLLPMDLAVSSDSPHLQAILAHYSTIQGIPLKKPEQTQVRYSEMDNILLAMNASEYLTAFKHHQIDLAEFLLLDEPALIAVGVDKVGLRKKMLDAIADMQKRQWEKSSVPKVLPRDKQSGIYLYAPDAALIIASVSRHMKFLSANIEYINRNIRDKPQFLQYGCDVATIGDIAKFTRESQENLSVLNKTIVKLDSLVSRQVGNAKNYPLDSTEESAVPKKRKDLALIFALSVISFLGIYAIYFRE